MFMSLADFHSKMQRYREEQAKAHALAQLAALIRSHSTSPCSTEPVPRPSSTGAVNAASYAHANTTDAKTVVAVADGVATVRNFRPTVQPLTEPTDHGGHTSSGSSSSSSSSSGSSSAAQGSRRKRLYSEVHRPSAASSDSFRLAPEPVGRSDDDLTTTAADDTDNNDNDLHTRIADQTLRLPLAGRMLGE